MAVLLLGLMVCAALLPSTLGRSRHIPHKHSSLAPQSSWNVTCTRDYSCLDCWTVQVCAPTPDGQSLYEIDRITCGSSRPYCNQTSGTCSYEKDPTCYHPNVTVSSNFTCMSDGYYPDPYNCSVYYHCQDETAYEYNCYPPYSNYDPEFEQCVSYTYSCANQSASDDCQYYKPGTKLTLYYVNNKFFYCGSNYRIITVDRCIGAYIFDHSAQMCVPYCPNAGLFPEDDDCANYYKCSPKTHVLHSGFLITDMTCPEGQAFSETEYSCVDRSLVPNCRATYPALFNK